MRTFQAEEAGCCGLAAAKSEPVSRALEKRHTVHACMPFEVQLTPAGRQKKNSSMKMEQPPAKVTSGFLAEAAILHTAW